MTPATPSNIHIGSGELMSLSRGGVFFSPPSPERGTTLHSAGGRGCNAIMSAGAHHPVRVGFYYYYCTLFFSSLSLSLISLLLRTMRVYIMCTYTAYAKYTSYTHVYTQRAQFVIRYRGGGDDRSSTRALPLSFIILLYYYHYIIPSAAARVWFTGPINYSNAHTHLLADPVADGQWRSSIVVQRLRIEPVSGPPAIAVFPHFFHSRNFCRKLKTLAKTQFFRNYSNEDFFSRIK